MNRVQVDASGDSLPMNAALDDTPAGNPLRDKTVNDGPTTANGPLSGESGSSVSEREITAHFATAALAEIACQELLDAGIASTAIRVIAHAAESTEVKAQARPADDTLIGRLREAVLPVETTAAAQKAVAQDEAILHVTPGRDQVETTVRILEKCRPNRFDADLERWRNKG